VLHLSLDSLGSVVDASIAMSSGHPRLDAAALDAAKKWRFSPETREGTPVSCELDLPVDFILRDKSR
jgi:protein TonB